MASTVYIGGNQTYGLSHIEQLSYREARGKLSVVLLGFFVTGCW